MVSHSDKGMYLGSNIANKEHGEITRIYPKWDIIEFGRKEKETRGNCLMLTRMTLPAGKIRQRIRVGGSGLIFSRRRGVGLEVPRDA